MMGSCDEKVRGTSQCGSALRRILFRPRVQKIVLCLLACGGHLLARGAPPVSHDPYIVAYHDGYRYVPYPVNTPYTPYKVPVYMYGYFGARPRHEPTRNQGFNDYINSIKRGYTW